MGTITLCTLVVVLEIGSTVVRQLEGLLKIVVSVWNFSGKNITVASKVDADFISRDGKIFHGDVST